MSCVGCAIAPYHTIDKDNIAHFVVAARARGQLSRAIADLTDAGMITVFGDEVTVLDRDA